MSLHTHIIFFSSLFSDVAPRALLQLVGACGDGALEHLQLQVGAGHDAVAAQHTVDGLARQFGVVVLLAQVAQPDVLQLLAHVLGDGRAAVAVVQVSRAGEDAVLKELRIGSLLHHLDVVVGLDDEVAGSADELFHLVRHVPCIGDDADVGACGFDEVAYVVAAVVRHAEGRHAELANLQRLPLLQQPRHVGRQLLGDAVVAVDAPVHLAGGIDGHVVVCTERADALNVVGMVVGDEDVVHLLQADTVLATVLLEAPESYTYIDKQRISGCRQVIAISTAATAKGDKL